MKPEGMGVLRVRLKRLAEDGEGPHSTNGRTDEKTSGSRRRMVGIRRDNARGNGTFIAHTGG